jgi:hypothetical protein
MSPKILPIIALLTFLFPALSYGQSCQDCKTRRVILYDNEVNVPRPTGSVDSIYRYWDYFYLAGGVKDYMVNMDPTRECITKLDGAFFTVPDTLTSNLTYGQEHANIPPAGASAGFTDYLLYGVVSGQSFTLKLETGKTREVVKSGVASLPKGFDPLQVGRVAAASVGPLYTTILDFEKRKRDEGEPYAIQPKISFIPGKTKLKANEKTNIDVLFKDCDGAPLKQRHITCTVDGGTLKSADVTTDDAGHGTLEFTAGSAAALANITATYPFEKPTGYQDAADVEPASIQIDKPNTSWYTTATLDLDEVTSLNAKDASEVKTAGGNEETKITFSAWVTNLSPLSGQFASTPLTTSQLSYAGSYRDSYHEHSHFEITAGDVSVMRDIQFTRIINAASTQKNVPELGISIWKDSYSIGIHQMDAVQTGGETSVTVAADPISGRTTDTQVSPASPTKTLGLSVQEVSRDTTYSISETTDLGDGRKTTTVTQVTQQFYWKDNVCKLTYVRGVREDSRIAGVYTEDSYSNQTYTVKFLLSYTGDPPTGVEAPGVSASTQFVLAQNYPNPFNPSTMISYALPKATHTTLTIIDLLGRRIATLVNEVKPAGLYAIPWNAGGLPSGVYFLQMRAGGFVETRKLLLAK